jgi:hypothetical protein
MAKFKKIAIGVGIYKHIGISDVLSLNILSIFCTQHYSSVTAIFKIIYLDLDIDKHLTKSNLCELYGI